MRVNAASLDIRDATTSTPGTLNDLTTDLIMANNNIYAISCTLSGHRKRLSPHHHDGQSTKGNAGGTLHQTYSLWTNFSRTLKNKFCDRILKIRFLRFIL